MKKCRKIAYLVLAHTDNKHLLRLINALDNNADFYIHIDKKSDLKYFKNIFEDRKNIFFVEKRYEISWGGFNMVLATKALMENALKRSMSYSHLVLLSGLDFPIKPVNYINEFLDNDIEFIRAFNITETNNYHYNNQIEHYWFMDIRRNIIGKIIYKLFYYIIFPLKKKTYIKFKDKELDVFFGSQWWALTPNCAKYILDYTKLNPEIDRYFKYSFSPDEKYFHTVVFNSIYKKKTNNGVEAFQKRGTYLWANLHIIDKSLSKYYKEDDIELIRESEKLFVRKVSSEESLELIKLIEDNNTILNKVR